MVQLTPDQLVTEFQDAVVELYFARKRIANLEAENADLKARLAAPTVPPQAQELPGEAALAQEADPAGEQWFAGGPTPGEPGQ
ncbi:hypothetical protein KV205_30375 [Streptomyces sp. SKN60]|uniref:hypothetical protein n=1 Tax=Streptomyces sp. SKN60 TaxID=2855506 RepID=UPI002247147A|nr:hypothetical protein [Streptomyces sp. SKN60]MCX2184802.1 hypothetical protein [Streptomyces sp. SKN60]